MAKIIYIKKEIWTNKWIFMKKYKKYNKLWLNWSFHPLHHGIEVDCNTQKVTVCEIINCKITIISQKVFSVHYCLWRKIIQWLQIFNIKIESIGHWLCGFCVKNTLQKNKVFISSHTQSKMRERYLMLFFYNNGDLNFSMIRMNNNNKVMLKLSYRRITGSKT